MSSASTTQAPPPASPAVPGPDNPQSAIRNPQSIWRSQLDDRLSKLLPACENYLNQTPEAGLPGHFLMILCALQARLLDDYERYIDQLEARPGTEAHDAQERPQAKNPHANIQYANGWPTKQERAAASMQSYGSPATTKQLAAIYAIGFKMKGWEDEETDEECRNVFSVNPNELTKAQASQFIDRLKAQ